MVETWEQVWARNFRPAHEEWKEIENELLEIKLDELLNPVTPSNTFIDELHTRLKIRAPIIMENQNLLLPILLVSTGLFLGIAIIYGLRKTYKLIIPSRDD